VGGGERISRQARDSKKYGGERDLKKGKGNKIRHVYTGRRKKKEPDLGSEKPKGSVLSLIEIRFDREGKPLVYQKRGGGTKKKTERGGV